MQHLTFRKRKITVKFYLLLIPLLYLMETSENFKNLLWSK